ncbi:uncharacterized protein LOC119632932 [Glossina fuscipes]|uniref:Uncharacterized protein LOC119632932 n=1 Tax=Glossina fuscipes TaxID=7396 RepID=A0A8U0WA01_9MUSC|nr:uncharacterized protein LOC119632932 [Glossina fuscipes]KAI9585599.1 hypothetical protein GQX74_001446 [Glossina fuscipes]
MSSINSSSDRSLRHYELEEKTLNQLLELENEFRDHYNFAKKELTQQMEWANRLWVLTQRYILLKSTGPCCKYPEIYPAPAEDNVLLDMTEKIKSIRNSNCRIYASVKELRKSCIIFEQLCSQLDMSVESPFIMGDAFHKPLSFFIELVSDLFKYLHASILRQRYSSHLIEPSNLDAVAKYKSLIEPSEDFEEYLTVGLTYCKCLRPKPIC